MKKELKRVVGIVLVLTLVIASVIPFNASAYNAIDTTDQDGKEISLYGFMDENGRVPVPYDCTRSIC